MLDIKELMKKEGLPVTNGNFFTAHDMQLFRNHAYFKGVRNPEAMYNFDRAGLVAKLFSNDPEAQARFAQQQAAAEAQRQAAIQAETERVAAEQAAAEAQRQAEEQAAEAQRQAEEQARIAAEQAAQEQAVQEPEANAAE